MTHFDGLNLLSHQFMIVDVCSAVAVHVQDAGPWPIRRDILMPRAELSSLRCAELLRS